jgi:hypothetical protein
MGDEAEGGVKRNGDGSGADGDMGRRDADEIDEKRYGKDRTAAANQAEGESDKGA